MIRNPGPHPFPCVALYVHVPFCQARCAYCDFTTYAGLETLLPAYVAALCREIENAGKEWGRLAASTIFFGGGTPSLLSPDLFTQILHVLRFTFHVSRDAEITIEANPGTLTTERLHRLRTLGVNRLSLGVQSAHDGELYLLGRIHTWAQAVEAAATARAAGFDNLNLDFIFGLPGQTLARWRKTLETALTLGPEHLSLYCLGLEQGTPLEKQIAAGRLPPPDEDLAAEMYTWAEERLAEAGYFHYEISNWARADLSAQRWWPEHTASATSEVVSPFVCRHNLTYWRNEPWLGLGAGAHSWLNRHRWANVRHPQDYIAALEQGRTPMAEMEPIVQRLEMGETMMLGLRLAEGVNNDRFHTRFGVALGTAFGGELTRLLNLGLLDWDGQVARLTARGRLLGNQVFVQFV